MVDQTEMALERLHVKDAQSSVTGKLQKGLVHLGIIGGRLPQRCCRVVKMKH